jgi:hypothetical protein
MTNHASLVPFLFLPLVLVACGGGNAANGPAQSGGSSSDESAPSAEEIAAATKPCGKSDQVKVHDLNADKPTEAFAPCASSGGGDYSGLIKIETVDNGVHIIIDARDDQVELLGPDVKSRDAVIVYPKGKDSKVAVEVPLMKTRTGYHGDKIVLWDDLGKLTDEGTLIDVAIFDHDKGQPSEEMHVALAVSTGKSCEKAIDENPQRVDFGKKGGAPDLTNDQLGAPMRTSQFMSGCALSDDAKADICVAVKGGRPLGVSVSVSPQNNKVAACIDRATRRLSFPVSDKLDVVHQKF